MKFFIFDSFLSIGDYKIDSQHKKLFEIFENLLEALAEGKGKDVILKVFDELSQYAIYHFNDEEELMEKINYPYFYIHKKEHQLFTANINYLIERYKYEYYNVTSETADFLFHWLKNHIMAEDKKIAYYLKGNKNIVE